MKSFTLASSLIAALALTAAGESSSALLTKISLKEKELARVTLELSSLRKQLSAAPKSTQATYTVKSGDTLSKIARRNNVTYSQLIKWNKISDPSLISIGQELIVSETAATKPLATATPAPSSKPAPKSFSYTISRGDTFYGIARKNGISLGKLTALNPGVDPSRIVSGQKLKVSGSPAPAVRLASTPTKKATAKPAPIKSSTTALTRSSTPKKSSATPISTRKKSEPKPVAQMDVKSAPAPAPIPPKVEASAPPAPKSVSSIILTNETTFSDFASKHRASTSQLNALNGWNLPKATVLARGSEIYVPK